MSENLTQKQLKSSKLMKPFRDYEIYRKNRGLAGFKKKSYFQLAMEYGMTPQAIAKAVKRVGNLCAKFEGKVFFKDGIPLGRESDSK